MVSGRVVLGFTQKSLKHYSETLERLVDRFSYRAYSTFSRQSISVVA